MKNPIRKVIIIVVGLLVFCFIRDIIIKNVVTVVASSVTGAPIHIGGFSLSVINQSVKISDLKMYSPQGFPRDVMVDIPVVNVSCDMFAVLGGKIHVKKLVLDLRELGLVKNKEGKLNVDSLKLAQPEDKAGEKKSKKPAKQPPLRIDEALISFGRLVSKDYTAGTEPVIKVYDINLKKSYKNINGSEQLAALIISEPLKAAGIQGAKIYGASILTGVAALPVTAVLTFAGKDFAQASYDASFAKVYQAGLKVLKESGRISKENKSKGLIVAEINGAAVNLKLKKLSENKTEVTVSARKFMLPQPEVSAGVIYRLNDEF